MPYLYYENRVGRRVEIEVSCDNSEHENIMKFLRNLRRRVKRKAREV